MFYHNAVWKVLKFVKYAKCEFTEYTLCRQISMRLSQSFSISVKPGITWKKHKGGEGRGLKSVVSLYYKLKILEKLLGNAKSKLI